jgi:hypothetical protein
LKENDDLTTFGACSLRATNAKREARKFRIHSKLITKGFGRTKHAFARSLRVPKVEELNSYIKIIFNELK